MRAHEVNIYIGVLVALFLFSFIENNPLGALVAGISMIVCWDYK